MIRTTHARKEKIDMLEILTNVSRVPLKATVHMLASILCLT